MSSRESDQADRRERGRAIDQALTDDRRGRDRLIRAADEEIPASHGAKSEDLAGVRTREPL